MRMFNFFTSATVCYLLLRLLLLAVPFFDVQVPGIFYSVTNNVSFLLFLLVYLSLGFILRYYKEKNWYSILIYLYLAFSVLNFVLLKVGYNRYLYGLFGIVNVVVLLTFCIGSFFVKAREISGLFKCLAVGMLADPVISFITPFLYVSYNFPKLIFILGIISLFPVAIIFLLNKKISLQPVYDQDAFNIE